jgi:hypothetical protein
VRRRVDQFKALPDPEEASNQLTYWLTALVAAGANDTCREGLYRAAMLLQERMSRI